VQDREQVKSFISSKACKNELVYKEILQKNSKLLKNHKNWVQSGVLKESEFWITLDKEIKEFEFLKNQEKPPSSLLLSDLKPEGDGENDLKYTLNPEIIHSIFTTYPAVLKAYQENVPLKLSEKEFWTKYFSSQYYYRKKMGLESSTKIKGDIFDLYADLDDLDLQVTASNLEFNSSNKLLDLSSTEQDHNSGGNRKDLTMRHGSTKESLGLIRRFNRHSDMVLKAIKYCLCYLNLENKILHFYRHKKLIKYTKM
jgi:transcription initiation factor TFIIH subunit 1